MQLKSLMERDSLIIECRCTGRAWMGPPAVAPEHRCDVHSGTWATRRAAACLGSLPRVFTELADASAFPACSRSSELKSQKASELRSPALASVLGKH